MDIQIENIDDVTIVHLKGALDRTVRGSMEIELLSLVSYGSMLLLDLSQVDYISSAGLHLLLNLYRRCEGEYAHLALTGLSDQVREILSMTGFTSGVLPIYDTQDEGMTALRSQLEAANTTTRGGFGFEDTPAAPDDSFTIPKMEEKEEVSFSAFFPKQVIVEEWHTLLVYTYVASMLEAIRKDSRKFEDEIGEISESKPATTQLARGTEITIVPTCKGVTFNPERVTFQWLEDRHRAEFRLRANASLADTGGTTLVTIYVGPLIVATLKMGMIFSETGPAPGSVRSEEVSTEIYHQDDIFISYSHDDTAIVKNCKIAYEALGHNILIDFETLRSGQKWNPELMNMIERANIFQLFWSEKSSKSKYCRQEWQYALELNRGEGFIRPVYWEDPIPTPPAELGDLHFDFAPFVNKD